MDKDRLVQVLRRDEGVRSRPYCDSRGFLTIGVGRNLATVGIALWELRELDRLSPLPFESVGEFLIFLAELEIEGGYWYPWLGHLQKLFPDGLSDPQIDLLLDADIKRSVSELGCAFSEFCVLPGLVQEVLVNVMFNLGSQAFSGFRKMISALHAADWSRAAAELLDSRAARQTGSRYLRLARVLRTQSPEGFELPPVSNIL